MAVLIREFCKEDVDAVSAIAEQVFTLPWSPKDFEQLLEDKNCLYLVAVQEGKVVGCCGVMNILGEGDINNVMVEECCRGQGIAYAMLKELLERGKTFGIDDFTLEVRVSNAPAIHVYEKLGFVSEGIRPRFYEKPVEDAMIMWKRKEVRQ